MIARTIKGLRMRSEASAVVNAAQFPEAASWRSLNESEAAFRMTSQMDRPLPCRKSGFLHRLVDRGMGMADAADILRRRREFHRHGRFGDHRAGFGADDVHAQHLVGGLV